MLELTILGRTQHQIAGELGVSQAAVSKILRRVEERLVQDLAPMVDRLRVRHTLRLDHVYGEAMTAWIDSKTDAVRRRQRKSDGSGTGTTVAELVSENRHGDPRYLDVARKALADLREVWGVNAPERLAVTATSPMSGLSDDELAAELARQARIYHQLGLPVATQEPSHD